MKAYFQTMVSRLHNFDGSMQIPKTEKYVQYVIRQVPAAGETSGDVNGYARVITSRTGRGIFHRLTMIPGLSGKEQISHPADTQTFSPIFRTGPQENICTETLPAHP